MRKLFADFWLKLFYSDITPASCVDLIRCKLRICFFLMKDVDIYRFFVCLFPNLGTHQFLPGLALKYFASLTICKDSKNSMTPYLFYETAICHLHFLCKFIAWHWDVPLFQYTNIGHINAAYKNSEAFQDNQPPSMKLRILQAFLKKKKRCSGFFPL